MKNICLLLFSVFCIAGKSQYFTNGSIYDYSVGDTIVTIYEFYDQGYGYNPVPTFTYRMFTGKSFSPNNDSIYYAADEVKYRGPVYPSQTPTYTYQTVAFAITNLNDTLINYDLPHDTSCQLVSDVTGQISCGAGALNCHTKAVQSHNCFEPPILEHTFIEGVGILVYTRSNNSMPKGLGSKTWFIAASKVGKNCKPIGMVPNAINEMEFLRAQIKIYPNPSQGSFSIELPQQ